MRRIDLTAALQTRGTDRFRPELQAALTALDAESLCLHQATTMGGCVDADSIAVTILSIADETGDPVVRVGVFFNEIVGGCNCHDDPVASPAYCELIVSLDAVTGQAEIRKLTEV